ncbi:MAG: glycosyltransferase family 9 protein [Deltaproteobacteria bacterium]|nr:glycosyltransferase family 9 protein [Deltaproteobacteria bacterium]
MDIEKICVIHLNQIGDLVFSLPLLRALKDAFPGAVIHSVVKPYLKGLLEDSPYVESIFIRDKSYTGRLDLAKRLRSNGYDLLISLARSQEAMLLTAMSGARKKAGFVHFPWDKVLDVKETVAGHNCWINNARLLEKLGVNIIKNDYVGLLKVQHESSVRGLPEKYVIISAGASRRRLVKAWDEEKYADVIVSLHREYGLSPVLVGGGDTLECNGLISRHLSESFPGEKIEVIDLTGALGLRELYPLLERADLFLGIDSGVMHMASAADIPVVALFGPTDPYYVGPQNRESIVVRKDMKCAPCYLNRSCKDIDCMRALGADAVMDACRSLLDGKK